MGPRLRPKPSDYKPPPRQTTFTPWANTQTSLPSTWVQPPASDEDSTDQETTPDTDENASPESLETSSSPSNVSGQKRSRKQLKRQRARQAAREKHERRFHALRARARDAIRAAAECEAQGVENDADATTLVRPVNTRGPYRTWVKEGWLPLIHLTNLSLGSVTKGVTFMRNWVFCGERHLAHLPVNTVRAWYANVCMLELRPEYHKLTLPGADPSEFRSGTWHGSAKFADKYPDFVQHMCEVFRGMREAGLLLTSDIVAEQFRHFAKEWCPQELIHMAFSRPWCRGICREKLNYVFRKATGAAQKLPLDWQTQKEDFVRRVTAVYMVECEDLAFVVNLDHTGVRLIPAGNYTYDVCGKKDIKVVGMEDKRQVTVLVGSAADGRMLPCQVIYAGTSPLCLPKEADREPCREQGWDFDYTENHWASMATTQGYFERGLDLWYEMRCRQLQKN